MWAYGQGYGPSQSIHCGPEGSAHLDGVGVMIDHHLLCRSGHPATNDRRYVNWSYCAQDYNWATCLNCTTGWHAFRRTTNTYTMLF